MKGLSGWIEQKNNWFWGRVVRSTKSNAESMAVYRIIAGLFFLLFSTPAFSWLSTVPQALFTPPVLSFANLFKGFPPAYLLFITDIVLLVLIIFVTLGIKAKISALAFVIISVLCRNFQYSFGKIDHDILIYVLLFCSAFSSWGQKVSFLPDNATGKHSYVKSLSLLSVLLCFAYFSAGFQKAISWLNFNLSTSGSASWFYNGYFSLNRTHLLAPFFLKFPLWIFKIMDVAAVLFELSPFVFLLTSRKAWRCWLIIACFFHLSNTFILNINFISLSIIYLAFIDYSSVYEKTENLVKSKFFKVILVCSLTVIFLVKVYRSASLLAGVKTFSRSENSLTDIYIAIAVWLVLIVLLLNDVLKIKKASPIL